MAVFRVEKNRGYTVMSNHHLRNKALSLKAKGLLSQMYHNADRRRTIGKITAAMPGMDGDIVDAGPADPFQAETYDGF